MTSRTAGRAALARAAGGAARSALDGAASGLKKDSGPLKSSRGAARRRARPRAARASARGGDAAARAVVRAPSPTAHSRASGRPVGLRGGRAAAAARWRRPLRGSGAGRGRGGRVARCHRCKRTRRRWRRNAVLAACERSCSQALSLGCSRWTAPRRRRGSATRSSVLRSATRAAGNRHGQRGRLPRAERRRGG